MIAAPQTVLMLLCPCLPHMFMHPNNTQIANGKVRVIA